MTQVPKVFIGTLHVNEAEFELCREAVRGQQGVEVTHHVISNKPEAEAHKALWSAWYDVKDDFDLFVKIDADTILMEEDALSRIWELFSSDRDVTGAQILLLDYFTRTLIPGLNCFTPEVVFRTARSKLFCDHADTNHRKVLRGNNVTHLSPIAWHCKFPNAEQAFHFGLHRAMKRQKKIIRMTAESFLEEGGEGRMWALAGAKSASIFMRNSYNYNSVGFQKKFQKLQNQPILSERMRSYAESLL